MITQIEIDGFKSFKNFKVELAPFQVIVGANGSGKSNLFDALHLLGHLAETSLREAFQHVRGEADEVFTQNPGNNPTTTIRLAVELFVNPTIKDTLGRQGTLRTRRLRYEIHIERGLNEVAADQFYVAFESLTSIVPRHDSWMHKHCPALLDVMNAKEQQHPAVDTSEELIVTRSHAIQLMPDGQGTHFSLPMGSGNAALQGVTNIEYPHVFAVRQELRSLYFFQLNPALLRQPSSIKAPQTLGPDGENLAATLFRLQKGQRFALTDISRDMAHLVPGIIKIQVKRDQLGERYVVYAETADNRVFSSRLLSDGTLRLLALATLKNDPQFHGIFCLEEPENGVSPLHLERMAHLLRWMATDLSDADLAQTIPLRQVLVTTHSPLFVSQPDMLDTVLVAIVPTRIHGTDHPVRVTLMVPAMTPEMLSHVENISREEKALGAYTANLLQSYLDCQLLEEARELLEQGHADLNTR